MSSTHVFTPDSVTVAVLRLTASLLVFIVLPLLFLVCRLRDVGDVRRAHPRRVAQHTAASLFMIGVFTARVVIFSTSPNRPVASTVSSCDVLVQSLPAWWRTRALRIASVQLWNCVSDAYLAPFELLTSSRSSSLPTLAHVIWWREVTSLWQPIAVVVVESAAWLLAIATFINMMNALWRESVRSVEIAIHRGQLNEYTRRTRHFLRDVRPVASASSSQTTMTRNAQCPQGQSGGVRSSDTLANSLFDESVRVREPVSAKREQSLGVGRVSTPSEPLKSRHASLASATSGDEKESDAARLTNASPLSSSLTRLWHALQLPTFGRQAQTAQGTVTATTAASLDKGQSSSSARAMASRHVTFDRGPLADGEDKSSDGSDYDDHDGDGHASDRLVGLSSLRPSSGSYSRHSGALGAGGGFSFGSVSEDSGRGGVLRPVAGDTVTVRPRLNVQSLALQQRLLKVQERQRQRRKRERDERYERKLLASLWTPDLMMFTLTAIPFVVVCACRVVLLVVSAQLSESVGTKSLVVAQARGLFGGPAHRTSGQSSSRVVFVPPIDGYLGLAGALVLLGDYLAAARSKRAVVRLHHSRAARDAIPHARPHAIVTATLVMFPLAAQMCPLEVHVWGGAVVLATVCLCVTTIRLTLAPIRQTLRNYEARREGHSRAALVFGLWFHPVDSKKARSQRDAEDELETAQERRRSRRVILATQAATAATTAMNDASNGNPMAAEDAATVAAQAVHSLLPDELVDELTGGVCERDLVATAAVGDYASRCSSLRGDCVALRGGGADHRSDNSSFVLRDAIVYAAAAVQQRSSDGYHKAGAFGQPNSNNNDTDGGSSYQCLPPVAPLAGLGFADPHRTTPGQQAARAATSFWENIATRVHEQHNGPADLAQSDSTLALGASAGGSGRGGMPALLDSVEVDANRSLRFSDAAATTVTVSDMTDPLTDASWSPPRALPTNGPSTSTSGDASGYPPEGSTSMRSLFSHAVASSAAVVSALMPDVPAEGVDDTSETTMTRSDSNSGGGSGGDSTHTDTSDRRRPTNSSTALPGQHHRHTRKAAPTSTSDAIATTSLGDLHGSILLKVPMAIRAGTKTTTGDQPHAQNEAQQDVTRADKAQHSVGGENDARAEPLHSETSAGVSAEGTTTTATSSCATDDVGVEDASSASSGIPAVLRKSFALLAHPAEWFGRGGENDEGRSGEVLANDGASASATSGTASSATGAVTTTSYGSNASSTPARLPPMLILDPPSDHNACGNDESLQNDDSGLTNSYSLPGHKTQGGQAMMGITSLSLSSGSMPSVVHSAAVAALSEEGRSAAIVASVAKAARALRAVAVGNADGGFSLFLEAVRHSGNNLTMLRELMAPTGTLYAQMRDQDGRTALHHAALGNHVHGVEFLLEMGADPNARDGKGLTPLHVAVIAQCDYAVHPDIDDDPGHISEQHGRRQGASYHQHQLPVGPYAIRNRRPPLPVPSGSSGCGDGQPPPRPRSSLLPSQPATTATTVDQTTGTVAGFPAPAGAVGSLKQTQRPHRAWRGIITALVRYGADVNAASDDGRTPLHMVIASELVGAVQTLLREGADPLARWEDEDDAESAQPGSGRWVTVHITNGGVVSGASFRKSPLLYALEVGSSMSVASILAFMQLEEEILRQGIWEDITSRSRQQWSPDDVVTLKSLLKKNKKKGIASRRADAARAVGHVSEAGSVASASPSLDDTLAYSTQSTASRPRRPSEPGLGGSTTRCPSLLHAPSSRTESPTSSSVKVAADAEARAMEAVKASTLVPPTQRRRRVIAKTTARAVAQTASAVAAAVCLAESVKLHRRARANSKFSAPVQQSRLTPVTSSAATLTDTTQDEGVRVPTSSCTSRAHSTCTPTTASLTGSHAEPSDTAGTNALNELAGAWGRQFMPQCLHGLTILDVALVLGKTNVVETVLRHHVLWFHQTRLRDGELARWRRRNRKSLGDALRRSNTMKRQTSPVTEAGGVDAHEADKDDDDEEEAIEEVDSFSDRGEDDAHSMASLSSRWSGSQSGRSKRRTKSRWDQAWRAQAEYQDFLQSTLLPTLSGSGGSVVCGVAEVAAAYAQPSEPVRGDGDGDGETNQEIQGCHATTEGGGGKSDEPPDASAVSSLPRRASALALADSPAAREAVEKAAVIAPSDTFDCVDLAANTVGVLQRAAPTTAAAMVCASGAQRRQTLFHYVAIGDSTEAVAYVLHALGMPDFVPEGNPFAAFDTAWRVQHPHRTRDTRLVSHTGHAISQSTHHTLASAESHLGVTSTGVVYSPGRLTMAATGVFDGTRGGTSKLSASTTVTTTTTTHAPKSSAGAAARHEARSSVLAGVEDDAAALLVSDGGAGVAASSDDVTVDSQHVFLSRVIAGLSRLRETSEKAAADVARMSAGTAESPMWGPAGASFSLSVPGAPNVGHPGSGAAPELSHSQTRRRPRHALAESKIKSESMNGSITTGGVAADAFSPWKNAHRRIEEHRKVLASQPLMHGRAPNMLRAVPMSFNTAVMKLRQRAPTIPIDLPHLGALEAAVDHVCHSALDMAGHEIHRLQRALLVVSLHLQQQLLQQRARRRRSEWYPRTAGAYAWHWPAPRSGGTTSVTVSSDTRSSRVMRSAPSTAATTPATTPTTQTCAEMTVRTLPSTTEAARPQCAASSVSVRDTDQSGAHVSGAVGGVIDPATVSAGTCHGLAAAPADEPPQSAPSAAPRAHPRRQQHDEQHHQRVRATIARVMVAMNRIDEYGLTPLHYVIANHNASMVYTLCCHGAVFMFASEETRRALYGRVDATAAQAFDKGVVDSVERSPSRTSTPARPSPPPLPPPGMTTRSAPRDGSTTVLTAVEAVKVAESSASYMSPVSPVARVAATIAAATADTHANSRADHHSDRLTAQCSASGSSPGGSGWIEASDIPTLTETMRTAPPKQEADATAHTSALSTPDAVSAVLPSTPRMDSFLTSTPSQPDEAHTGLRRVSVAETAEARATLDMRAQSPTATTAIAAQGVSTPGIPSFSIPATPPMATTTVAKPPLAPSGAPGTTITTTLIGATAVEGQPPRRSTTSTPTLGGGGAGGSDVSMTDVQPLVELYPPVTRSTALAVHGTSSNKTANSERPSTFDALEGMEAVAKASSLLCRYCSAYASQLPIGFCQAVDVVGEARSARRFLEVLEATTLAAPSAAQQQASSPTSLTAATIAAVATPAFAPMPGALMEPHDIFVMHAVRDPVKAASIIHAGLEGMAVWKQRSGELAACSEI